MAAALARASRPVVLVDGRSGSGKTSLATVLAPALRAQLVSLDDLYPGWDGLEAGSAAVVDIIGARRWTRWDWAAGRPGGEQRIDPERPLVVEGCGALSRRNRELATLGVWVDSPDDLRKRRALARDGEAYAREWDRWAAQEDVFLARERPGVLADVIVREDSSGALRRTHRRVSVCTIDDAEKPACTPPPATVIRLPSSTGKMPCRAVGIGVLSRHEFVCGL
ncbi:MAG: ATP-binding protein [Naasia sp.]|nr:ATP-binding protein [Naasia sp.]